MSLPSAVAGLQAERQMLLLRIAILPERKSEIKDNSEEAYQTES